MARIWQHVIFFMGWGVFVSNGGAYFLCIALPIFWALSQIGPIYSVNQWATDSVSIAELFVFNVLAIIVQSPVKNDHELFTVCSRFVPGGRSGRTATPVRYVRIWINTQIGKIKC